MAVPEKVILACRGVRKHHGVREILSDVTLSVHLGDRLGLLGANGAGKSTLLKLLAGRDTPDGGEMTVARGLTVGLLDQDFRLDPAATVRRSVEGGLQRILGWKKRLDEIDALFHADPPDPGLDHAALLAEQADLHERLDHAGAEDIDRRIDMVSAALGLPPGDRIVGTLSGGEARRTALAAVLLSEPDLLLLDEPTNHLDAETVEWLERFLADHPGTVILVTHDRYFLDRVANRMVELERGRLTAYAGNYSAFLEQKAEREEVAARNEQTRRNLFRRELAWMRRGAKARTTKAKGRIQRFEALRDAAPGDDLPRAEFRIPDGPRLGTKVLDVKGLAKSYGGRSLFRGFDLSLQAGDVVGVVGRNGAGKSTLIRILLGREQPDAGTVETGTNTRIVFTEQGRGRLDPAKTMVEVVADGAPHVMIEGQIQRVETYLMKFGFDAEVQRTAVGRLSGGEQNRVQLAWMLRGGGNVLVMDEPTNDLDLDTLRVLEDAVEVFEGSAVIVSHDRWFLNRLCTHILAFEGGDAPHLYSGNYDDWRATKARQTEPAPAPASDKPRATAKPAATTAPANTPSAAPAKRKLSWAERKELDGIGDAIAAAEAEVADVEGRLADPTLYSERPREIADLVRRQTAAREKVAALYARWETLESLAAG